MTAKEAVNWIINIMADIGKSEHRALWHYEQTLMEIRKMLEASAQQWIPCSERLPERDEDVLVTRDYDGRKDHNKSCRYVEVASCYGDDDILWSSYSDEYKMTPKNHHVIAWMPLPEPYKAERREDG